MRFRTALPWLVALMTVSACDRPDTLALSYRFQPGRTLTYRLDAHARARWEIGRPGRGSYEVTFRVTETVQSVSEAGAVLAVEMVPTDVTEKGFPSPGAQRRSFSLQLDSDGKVVRVLRVRGGPARELDADQVAFIATYRPPLPEQRTRLQGAWQQRRGLSSGSVSQEMETRGRLETLGRDERGPLAGLDYAGRGRLLLTAALPEGRAELRGVPVTRIDALLDVDGGFMRKATSSTQGDFQVSVIPARGAAPIEAGTLHLDLDLNLQQI